MPFKTINKQKVFYREITQELQASNDILSEGEKPGSCRNINLLAEKDNQKTIVLLHGLGTDHHCFKYQIPALKQKYRLILIDLPGFGHSNIVSKSYTLDEITNIIMLFLVKLKIKKFHLIGLSLGGMVAIKIAQNNELNKKIDKVILISTAVTFGKLPIITKIPLYFRLFLTFFIPYKISAKIIARKVFSGSNNDNLKSEFYNQLLNSDKGTYRKLILSLRKWDSVKYLSNIKNDYWILGDKDQIIKSNKQKLFLKNKPVTTLSGNHIVNIINPQEVNKEIISILGTVG